MSPYLLLIGPNHKPVSVGVSASIANFKEVVAHIYDTRVWMVGPLNNNVV